MGTFAHSRFIFVRNKPTKRDGEINFSPLLNFYRTTVIKFAAFKKKEK